jgi:putative DNA primase/helicase
MTMDEVIREAMQSFRRGLNDGAKLGPLPRRDKKKPKATLDKGPSDNLLAERFVSLYKDKVRYVHKWKSWLIWTGTHWMRDERGTVFDAIRRCNIHSGVYSVAKTNAVEKFAQSFQNVSVETKIWNRDPFLLGTPDGTVDLRTGKLKPAEPTDYITMVTAVAPAPVADETTCPRWLQFMREINNQDAERIRFEQQWSGYSLTGDTREQCLLFIYGPGGNGKGIRCQITFWLMGEYAHMATIDLFLVTFGDKHTTSQAALYGKRVVIASETQEGRTWDITLIKQLTGGDPITARFMRCDDFTFIPELKLIISSNNLPKLPSVGIAEKRRFNVKKYDFQPAEVDFQLINTLKKEGPGILRWMIDGCVDWQQHGLIRPDSVVRETEEYMQAQDDFDNWLQDCAELDRRPNATIGEPTGKLFASWRMWAEARNVRVGREAELVDKLKSRCGCRHTTHFKVNGPNGEVHEVRGFYGIRVLSSAPDDSSDAPF